MSDLKGLGLVELVARHPDRIFGIDVSHYQGEPNFLKARDAGARFVYIKASEGRTWQDRRFNRNWMAAQEAGLPRGAYHVAHLYHDDSGVTDARGGARNLLSMTTGGEMPLVLDLETKLLLKLVRARGAKAAHDWIGEWIDEVLQAGCEPPMIYMSRWTVNLLGEEAADLPLLDTWWADYRRGDGPPRRRDPRGTLEWPTWRIRQHGVGSVPGVVGPCDLNFFNGGEEAFARWLKMASPQVEDPSA